MAENNKAALSSRDKQTLKNILEMANAVAKQTLRKKDPAVDIPVRALSNVHFNERKKIIEMGKRTSQRQLFNLSQAKS